MRQSCSFTGDCTLRVLIIPSVAAEPAVAAPARKPVIAARDGAPAATDDDGEVSFKEVSSLAPVRRSERPKRGGVAFMTAPASESAVAFKTAPVSPAPGAASRRARATRRRGRDGALALALARRATDKSGAHRRGRASGGAAPRAWDRARPRRCEVHWRGRAGALRRERPPRRRQRRFATERPTVCALMAAVAGTEILKM